MAFWDGVYENEVLNNSYKKSEKEIKNFDIDLATEAFKNKISSMSYEERKKYLEKMEFSYEEQDITKSVDEAVTYIENILKDINSDSSNLFIVELLSILGYKESASKQKEEQTEIIYNNSQIIGCIYPNINLNKMLKLFETNKQKIVFLNQCRELIYKYIMEASIDDYEVQKIK